MIMNNDTHACTHRSSESAEPTRVPERVAWPTTQRKVARSARCLFSLRNKRHPQRRGTPRSARSLNLRSAKSRLELPATDRITVQDVARGKRRNGGGRRRKKKRREKKDGRFIHGGHTIVIAAATRRDLPPLSVARFAATHIVLRSFARVRSVREHRIRRSLAYEWNIQRSNANAARKPQTGLRPGLRAFRERQPNIQIQVNRVVGFYEAEERFRFVSGFCSAFVAK